MDTSKTETRFKKSGLWKLFVAAAFPIHVWAIVLILRDISWVAERTNFWDAIGVAGYGIVFAFVESLLIFFLLVAIGLFMSRVWKDNIRVALLGVLIIVTTIWAIVGQLISLVKLSFSSEFVMFLARLEQPVWFINGGLLILITPTVLLSAYSAVFSKKFRTSFLSILDRISPLMVFYLILDFVGVLIVAIRNFN